MKKLLVIFFAFVLIISLASCMSDPDTPDTESTDTEVVTEAPKVISDSDYEGFWLYENGYVLCMSEGFWYLYDDTGVLISNGPLETDEDGAYLMNSDGSSGGGKVAFNDKGELVDSDSVLTPIDEFPYEFVADSSLNYFIGGEWLYSDGEGRMFFDGIGSFTWEYPDFEISGTYIFDGETLILTGDEFSETATMNEQEQLIVTGDAGSYYYRAE